jgi:GDPmannose 4,6-dehydratase
VKKALITGITGQDGSYLAEILLEKGYEVHGLVRRCSTTNTSRIAHLLDPGATGPASAGSAMSPGRVVLHTGDLADASSLRRIVEKVRPDELYNLGSQSDVRASFELPECTGDVTGLGAVRLLEAVRDAGLVGQLRFYQASSSEMFGTSPPPQDERTPFHPRSPYATAKVLAFGATVNYREAFGLFAVNGILFNHESPRRGEDFVTRKITRAAGRIAVGLQERLQLGNLEARRDWGFARDYVLAMWQMLQQPEPGDFVVATGQSHSVLDFCAESFSHLGLDWHDHVSVDPRLLRPADVADMRGNAARAREILGWEPRTSFTQLVHLMADADRELAEKERDFQGGLGPGPG